MRGRPPKEITRNIVVKIRLTTEENTLLVNVCERIGQTKSDVIRNALNEYLNERRCRNAAQNR